MILFNLNPGGTMSAPTGYPILLTTQQETVMSGFIPKSVTTVTASVQPQAGKANVHLALFTPPTTSNGSDGIVVVQTDALGVTSAAATSISVSVPATAAPANYVVRLWVDTITASNQDTIKRDGVTAVTIEPRVPVGVRVLSMVVS